MKMILVTVPHTGTRAVVKALGWKHKIIYEDFDKETDFPFGIHASKESRDFLMKTPVKLLSTYREPLRVAVSRFKRYPFLNPSLLREAFETWLELYHAGKLVVIDLRFLPEHGWLVEPKLKLPSVIEAERALVEKDWATLEKVIPGYFRELRKLDFTGLPCEGL